MRLARMKDIQALVSTRCCPLRLDRAPGKRAPGDRARVLGPLQEQQSKTRESWVKRKQRGPTWTLPGPRAQRK
eukprot:6807211-Pyramimonas_sp.AAC.1